mmetsp:Transcript_57403/g.65797  ORF Transcript_57403/g.65797 Transcript_57403/m.65797 type:complete len:218 (+) Transcript_57403:564-1217(+)
MHLSELLLNDVNGCTRRHGVVRSTADSSTRSTPYGSDAHGTRVHCTACFHAVHPTVCKRCGLPNDAGCTCTSCASCVDQPIPERWLRSLTTSTATTISTAATSSARDGRPWPRWPDSGVWWPRGWPGCAWISPSAPPASSAGVCVWWAGWWRFWRTTRPPPSICAPQWNAPQRNAPHHASGGWGIQRWDVWWCHGGSGGNHRWCPRACGPAVLVGLA